MKLLFLRKKMLNKIFSVASPYKKFDFSNNKNIQLFLIWINTFSVKKTIENFKNEPVEDNLFGIKIWNEDDSVIICDLKKNIKEKYSINKVADLINLYQNYLKENHYEITISSYLEDIFITSIPNYLEILKNKAIRKDDISSEVWDVDIIGDKVSIWFQFDEEMLPENEVLIDRDILIKVMEKWYEFLQKKDLPVGYEEIIEI